MANRVAFRNTGGLAKMEMGCDVAASRQCWKRAKNLVPDFGSICNLLMNSIPASIFKFASPERLDIILNQSIAFTPPNRFNDLFDVCPEVKPVTDAAFLRKRAKKAEREFLRSLPRSQRPKSKKERLRIFKKLRTGAVAHFQEQAHSFAANLEAQLQDEISKVFGILCLAEVRDEDLMWAHYADSHRGFVIEFDTAHPSFQSLGNPAKVEYLPHRPIYDAVEGAKGFWKQKPDRWDYEHEWRISRRLDECSKCMVKGVSIFLCPLSREAIKAVYLGARSDKALESKVRNALLDTNASLHRAFAETGRASLSFRKI